MERPENLRLDSPLARAKLCRLDSEHMVEPGVLPGFDYDSSEVHKPSRQQMWVWDTVAACMCMIAHDLLGLRFGQAKMRLQHELVE